MSKTIAVVLLGFALIIFGPSASHAIMIGFAPTSQTINLGDQFQIDVVVSDLGDEIVSAYDLDVNYDPSVLTATDVTFGNELDWGWFLSFQSFDITTPGVVDFLEVSLLSDNELAAFQPNNFTLATLSFDVLSLGSSPLTFTFDEWNDVKGLGNRILDIEPGTANVAPVPEPATILLLSSGLLGLVGASRKKNEKQIGLH